MTDTSADEGFVRRATASDVDAIVVLDRALNSTASTSRAHQVRAAVDAGECLVSEDAGRLSGFVVLRRRAFYGRDFVELLMVAPDARRRGVGRVLLRAAVKCATTDDVFTSTNESNAPMRALLEGEGWSFSGRLVGLDPGDPELVFYRGRGAR